MPEAWEACGAVAWVALLCASLKASLNSRRLARGSIRLGTEDTAGEGRVTTSIGELCAESTDL